MYYSTHSLKPNYSAFLSKAVLSSQCQCWFLTKYFLPVTGHYNYQPMLRRVTRLYFFKPQNFLPKNTVLSRHWIASPIWRRITSKKMSTFSTNRRHNVTIFQGYQKKFFSFTIRIGTIFTSFLSIYHSQMTKLFLLSNNMNFNEFNIRYHAYSFFW